MNTYDQISKEKVRKLDYERHRHPPSPPVRLPERGLGFVDII